MTVLCTARNWICFDWLEAALVDFDNEFKTRHRPLAEPDDSTRAAETQILFMLSCYEKHLNGVFRSFMKSEMATKAAKDAVSNVLLRVACKRFKLAIVKILCDDFDKLEKLYRSSSWSTKLSHGAQYVSKSIATLVTGPHQITSNWHWVVLNASEQIVADSYSCLYDVIRRNIVCWRLNFKNATSHATGVALDLLDTSLRTIFVAFETVASMVSKIRSERADLTYVLPSSTSETIEAT